MPPLRTGSWQNPANQEGNILLALHDLKDGRSSSICAAAKLYAVPRSTLQTRANGQISRADTRPSGHKLTKTEGDPLTEWIISMDTHGAAPRPSTVRDMANILLAARGWASPITGGKNWPSTFINRGDEIRSRFSRRYDYQRALKEDPKSVREWFVTVQRVIDKNGIQPEDIHRSGVGRE